MGTITLCGDYDIKLFEQGVMTYITGQTPVRFNNQQKAGWQYARYHKIQITEWVDLPTFLTNYQFRGVLQNGKPTHHKAN